MRRLGCGIRGIGIDLRNELAVTQEVHRNVQFARGPVRYAAYVQLFAAAAGDDDPFAYLPIN
jgi:hypothetical protein